MAMGLLKVKLLLSFRRCGCPGICGGGGCLCGPEVRSRLTVRSSWESVFRITKEASRLLTALTFF